MVLPAARLSLAFEPGSYRPFNARVRGLGIRLLPVCPLALAARRTVGTLRDWLIRSVVESASTPKGNSEVDPLPAARADPLRHPSVGLGAAGPADCQSRRSARLLLFALINAVLYGRAASDASLVPARPPKTSCGSPADLSARDRRDLRITCGAGEASARPGTAMEGVESLAWGAGRPQPVQTKKSYSIAAAALGEVRPSETSVSNPGGSRRPRPHQFPPRRRAHRARQTQEHCNDRYRLCRPGQRHLLRRMGQQGHLRRQGRPQIAPPRDGILPIYEPGLDTLLSATRRPAYLAFTNRPGRSGQGRPISGSYKGGHAGNGAGNQGDRGPFLRYAAAKPRSRRF